MNLAAILPILIGFLLDALLGDPHSLPHPVRFIGGFVNRLERCVRKKCNDLRLGGFLIVMTVIIASGGMATLIVIICYHINVITGIIAEGLMCYYLLAARSLRDESMKVYRAIHRHDTEGARKAVSMIVGRDTKSLDEQGVIRAAVETVAENTSDGVTAPLFYMMYRLYFYVDWMVKMRTVSGNVTDANMQARIQHRRKRRLPERCMCSLQGMRITLESYIKNHISVIMTDLSKMRISRKQIG